MNYADAKREVRRLFLGVAEIHRNKRLPRDEQCMVVVPRKGQAPEVIGRGSSYERALTAALKNASRQVDEQRAKAVLDTAKGNARARAQAAAAVMAEAQQSQDSTQQSRENGSDDRHEDR